MRSMRKLQGSKNDIRSRSSINFSAIRQRIEQLEQCQDDEIVC
jgi:hypothetical protein